MTFPPTKPEHIEEYDSDETVRGYLDYRPDDPVPGPNHSPGYRWGWLNGQYDRTGEPDGHYAVRRAFARKWFPADHRRTIVGGGV